MNLKKVLGIGFLSLGAAFAQEANAPAAPAAAPAENAVEAVAAPAADSTVKASNEAKTVEKAAEESVADLADEVESLKKNKSKDAPIAVPDAPVANKQKAWFAEASKVKPVVKKDTIVYEKKKKGLFDVLHGAAYNSVGNEAAADNVDDLLNRPDLFAGRQFLYIEPAAERGIFSVGSIFGAVDISGDLGRGTIGYARHGFGIAAHASLGQFHIDGDEGIKHSTEAGDDLGVDVSKVIGKYAVILNVDWLTYAKETGVDPEFGSSTDENYRDLTVAAGVTNAPGASGTNWSAGVEFLRHESNTENGGDVTEADTGSYIQIKPSFNFGALGLKSKRTRFYAGVNASVPVAIFDDDEDKSLLEFGLVVSPNILGEVAVRDDLMLFGEAGLDWLAVSYGDGSDENGSNYVVSQSKMNKATASIGLRYQYKDLVACEFALGDSFFTDTKSIFNGQDVFVSFGGFILF